MQHFMYKYDRCNDKRYKAPNIVSKKLQNVSYPSTIESARQLPTNNANPKTTVQ